MTDVNLDTLTGLAAESFALPDARQRELLHGLIAAAHGYVKAHRVTHDEWRQALAFLTACGSVTTPARNEFVLLSDITGVTSLVDLLSHRQGVTEGSVLGPFHNTDSLPAPNGTDLEPGPQPQALVVCGQVRSDDGSPLPLAELDLWQADASGLYPEQDPTQAPQHLRCRLAVGAEGRYAFRTVRPGPYGVPQDGPVGALLRQAGRTAMRAAHLHVIGRAPGHRPLITEVFFDGGAHLDDDAVFGVRRSLVRPIERCDDASAALPCRVEAPYDRLVFDLVLERTPAA